jgi:DMSO/TMAO reductase YedYZ molybdopterin-dependent catalytic subunit
MRYKFFKQPGEAGLPEYGDRVPPGQRIAVGWPVLHYGSVPAIDLESWRFTLSGLVEREVSLSWSELMALPQIEIRSDVHCVTHWSKFDNCWQGVAIGEILRQVQLLPEARFVTVEAFGDYTTNLRLEDLAGDDVLLAHSHDDRPLTPEHGGPLRLVVPKLYFWKSAKWVRGFRFVATEKPGFWEQFGYHLHGDPWQEERYG